MNKLLPKLLTTIPLITILAVQNPSKAFSGTSASSQSTPTHQSSKKSAKKSSKKTSSKKSSKKSTKHPKNIVVRKEQPKTEIDTIPQPEEPAGPPISQLVTAYHYAYELYAAHQFDKAKDIFKKIALVTNQPALK